MIDVLVNMKKEKTGKRIDTYVAEDKTSVVQTVYLNQSAGAPDQITVIVGDRK